MSENLPSQHDATEAHAFEDEGGLRAPPDLHGWRKAWWWFDFIILVKLARLRFIGVLVVIGVVITQWDTLLAYYDKLTRVTASSEKAAAGEEYFCPMDPGVVSDDPKEKCPICFMALAKRKKGSTESEPLPAGVVNRVQLSPYRIVLAGVATYPVDYQPLTKQITAVGYVEFNEHGQRTVSARVAGRIDKLFVNETGKMVEAGDDLALLYSPDLLVTAQSLLSAKRSGNQESVKSGRVRLELLGIDDAQVEEMLAADKAPTDLKIRSPINGHVITKYVREGQYVQEGTPLYDLADLSTVWIQAQLYEDDLAFLPVSYEHGTAPTGTRGLDVTATTRAFPNEPFQGKLAFVYPHVDQETRTVTVRFEVANPGHRLRPGSTASVMLTVPPKDVRALEGVDGEAPASKMLAEGRVLAVPESSVIDTGSQRIVYRQSSPGVFEGVEVKLGPRMTNPEGAIFYPLLHGLSAGESVVANGSFLVDAETRLNPAAGSIYFGGTGGAKGESAKVTTVRPSTPEDPNAKVKAALAKLTPEDRARAEAQKYCPVRTDSLLGSMGIPLKITLDGQAVFLCCAGCKDRAFANPKATLARAKVSNRSVIDEQPQVTGGKPSATDADGDEAEIHAVLAKLTPDDRLLAESQRFCPVLKDSRLGSMGKPVKLIINGEPVFICCDGCEQRARAKPELTLATVKRLTENRKTVPAPNE
jgi:Cu(I)/Ag(I) efflux system membrane fusion protein